MKLDKKTKKFTSYEEINMSDITKKLKESGVHFKVINKEFFLVNDEDKDKAEEALK